MTTRTGSGTAAVAVQAGAAGETNALRTGIGLAGVSVVAVAAGKRLPTRQSVILNLQIAGTAIPYEVGGG